MRLIAILVLAAVICCGTVLKLYARSKLKDLEGTYDTGDDAGRGRRR